METKVNHPIDKWTPLCSVKGAVPKKQLNLNNTNQKKANPQYLNDIGTYDTRIENKYRPRSDGRAGDFPSTDRVAFNQSKPPRLQEGGMYIVNVYSGEQAIPCPDKIATRAAYNAYNEFSLLKAE